MDNINIYAIFLFFASAAVIGYVFRWYWETYRPKKNTGLAVALTNQAYNGEKTFEEEKLATAKVNPDTEIILERLQTENGYLRNQVEELQREMDAVLSKADFGKEHEDHLQNLKITVRELTEQREGLRQKNEDLLNTVHSLESQFRDLHEKTDRKTKESLDQLLQFESSLADKIKENDTLRQQNNELQEKLSLITKAPNQQTNFLAGIGQLDDPGESLSGNVKLQMNRLHEAEKKQQPPADMKEASSILGVKVKWNDLKLVEGIGPKIEELFHKAGISTWHELADATVERCREILQGGGERFQMHNPATWPRQSKMLATGKWKQLKEFQLNLHGGKVGK